MPKWTVDLAGSGDHTVVGPDGAEVRCYGRSGPDAVLARQVCDLLNGSGHRLVRCRPTPSRWEGVCACGERFREATEVDVLDAWHWHRVETCR